MNTESTLIHKQCKIYGGGGAGNSLNNAAGGISGSATNGSGGGGAPWTKEEAEQWAETTIQAMKDNNDIFATPA